MQNVRLIVPEVKYLNSYLEACREFQTMPRQIHGLHDPDTFDEWKDNIFAKFEEYRRGENLPEDYVPASMFWLVNRDEFVGRGSVRHRLTPSLERFGGHIGYAIRPSKWNKGYGTIQLKFLLREAAKLGIRRTLITCDEDNPGSYRVMEKNGGQYQDTIDNIIDGKPRRTKRYWFDTPPLD